MGATHMTNVEKAKQARDYAYSLVARYVENQEHRLQILEAVQAMVIAEMYATAEAVRKRNT